MGLGTRRRRCEYAPYVKIIIERTRDSAYVVCSVCALLLLDAVYCLNSRILTYMQNTHLRIYTVMVYVYVCRKYAHHTHGQHFLRIDKINNNYSYTCTYMLNKMISIDWHSKHYMYGRTPLTSNPSLPNKIHTHTLPFSQTLNKFIEGAAAAGCVCALCCSQISRSKHQ